MKPKELLQRAEKEEDGQLPSTGTTHRPPRALAIKPSRGAQTAPPPGLQSSISLQRDAVLASSLLCSEQLSLYFKSPSKL